MQSVVAVGSPWPHPLPIGPDQCMCNVNRMGTDFFACLSGLTTGEIEAFAKGAIEVGFYQDAHFGVPVSWFTLHIPGLGTFQAPFDGRLNPEETERACLTEDGEVPNVIFLWLLDENKVVRGAKSLAVARSMAEHIAAAHQRQLSMRYDSDQFELCRRMLENKHPSIHFLATDRFLFPARAA